MTLNGKQASAPNHPPPLKRRSLAPFVTYQRTRHGKLVYYVRKGKGPRVRLPDTYGSPEFWEAYSRVVALAAEGKLERKQISLREPIFKMRGPCEQALIRSLKSARSRAKERGLPFDLDYDWGIKQLENQDFRCELTGIPFFSRWLGQTGLKDPFSPSIDRIEPSKGYVKENCRIVNLAINTMLLDWGQELFEKIATSYRVKKSKSLALEALENRK